MQLHKKTKAQIDIALLKKRGEKFSIESSASFLTLKYRSKKLSYATIGFSGIKGVHLFKMVKDDVNKLIPIEQIPRAEAMRLKQPVTVYVNPTAIDECVDEYVNHIDITNCYWSTALREGVITQRTHDMGLRKPEWKTGRNAAIGGLDKKVRYEEWNGNENTLVERIHMPANHKYARLKIINAIDEIALQLIKLLGEGFLMFLTDCFVVKPGYVDTVTSFLRKNGFQFKFASIIIKLHDSKEKYIQWDQKVIIRNKKTGKSYEKIDRCKPIHYNNRSIITFQQPTTKNENTHEK